MPWMQGHISGGLTENTSKEGQTRSGDLTVNTWPTGTDCIHWSADAEIVVTAGDNVQILLPKLKIGEDDPDALWEFLRLHVSSFGPNEVQHADPISSGSASMGEELSAADAVSAKWTPPDVARYGRCALMVHTQNLLLSIWAPNAQPRSPQDWRRRAIVNYELQRYFESIYPNERQMPGKPRSDRLKELIRVRAFVANVPLPYSADSSLRHKFRSTCFIAVSNDNNEVAILSCASNTEDDPGVQLNVEAHFSVTGEPAEASNLSWSFEDYMTKTRFVQHLAWSPWIVDSDGTLRSLLACGTPSKLFFQWILLSVDQGEPKLSIEEFEGTVRLKRPWTSDVLLSWLPDLVDGTRARLIACTTDKILQFGVDLSGKDKLQYRKCERQEWGQVAGKLFVRSGDISNESLQVFRHMTTSDAFFSELSLDSFTESGVPPGNTLEAIRHNRSMFDAKYEWTGGKILTKIWGASSSPLHDLGVVTATFHPGNSPEYIIPADMSTRLIFEPSPSQDDFMTRALKQRASTEAIAFSTKWLVNGMKTQPEKNAAIWALLDQIDKVMKGSESLQPVAEPASFENLLYNSDTLTRLRYERILSVMIGHSETATEMEKQVVEQIAIKVLQIPASKYRQTRGSALMLSNMRRALVKLSLAADDNNLGDEGEYCDICNANVAFEELGSAQCGKGHKFRRCALTFLAIQAPGISKSCGICGKQYLKTAHVDDQNADASTNADVEMMGTEEGSRDASGSFLLPLTELLSMACNRCVYCGGKFVG